MACFQLLASGNPCIDTVNTLQSLSRVYVCTSPVYRQLSKQCIRDITASSQHKYETCTAIFEEIFTERALFTDNKVSQFCSADYDCPDYVVNLNKRLVEDCNIHTESLVSEHDILP